MRIEITRSFGEGITVPYAPIFDDVRQNNGFTDLRGRPNLAQEVLEGSSSAALRELLVRIARERSYFSLGCDLGSHVEDEQPKKQRRVCGGYLQVASMNYAKASTHDYDAFCDAFGKELKSRPIRQRWKFDLHGTFVQFQLPREQPAKAPCVWIWFFAAAETEMKALVSREELLVVLADALHATKVQKSLSLE